MPSLGGILEAWRNLLGRTVSGPEIVGGELEESEDEPESAHSYDVYLEIEECYRGSLDKARAHLTHQKKPRSRAKLSLTRIAYILKHGGICPTCSVPLEGTNHNTEHILPLSLGGGNDDSNRAQLCSWCNTARNQTFMGINRGEKYPENWIIVKQYVLWSELTLDEGIRAGAVFPSIQDRFVIHRWGPNFKNIPKKPQNAFGRASEWGGEAKTQTARVVKQHRETKVQEGEKYPVTINLNSGMKGLRLPHEPKQLAEVLVWVATDSGNFTKYIDLREALKDTGMIPKHRAVHTLRAIFRAVPGTGRFEPEMVVSIDELPEICDRMWMNCSGQGDHELPQNVTPPDEEETKKYFENVKSELSQLKGKQSTGAVDSEFPLIHGLNGSKNGLRFPRNPEHLSEALIWFSENVHLYRNTLDLQDAMTGQTNLSLSRVRYLVSQLGNIVKPTTQRGIATADWSTSTRMTAIETLDELENWAYQTRVYQTITADEGAKLSYKQYFDQTRQLTKVN